MLFRSSNAKRSRLGKLMFSPDGKHLVVTAYTSGNCWIVDPADLTHQTLVPVAKGPMGMAFPPDGKSVIVRTYLTWRIDNPLDFYVTLKDPAEASRQLSSRLREIRGLISHYRFDELVNVDRSKLKLATIEADAAGMLDKALAEAGYGIKVESVGIHKIILPESTTGKVFDTMIAARERLAENALQEGQAQASAIRSEATSARERILAFAERKAQAIRSQGDREAAVQYESFAKNEEFAIFLRKIDALRKMLDHNTTFVLSADSLGILDWFNKDPAAAKPPQRGTQP